MFKIENGKLSFYQWDINQRLIIEEPSITEVHFCNRTSDCSLVCAVYEENGKRFADVPNILLQTDWTIKAYAYCENRTLIEENFIVYTRTKPADYIYSETEVKTFEALEKRINQIEENGISDEALEGAIERYFDENDINVDVNLTGYATEEFVNNAIANLDIPEGKSIVSYRNPLEVPLESGSQYILYGSDVGTITIQFGSFWASKFDYQLQSRDDVIWLLWMQTNVAQGSIITTSGKRTVADLKGDFTKMKISATMANWIVIKID